MIFKHRLFTALLGLLFATVLTDQASALYDPGVGRFCSRDPIGYLDGYNLFAYVRAQPLDFVDAHGLDRYRLGGNNPFDHSVVCVDLYDAVGILTGKQYCCELGGTTGSGCSTCFAIQSGGLCDTISIAFSTCGLWFHPAQIFCGVRTLTAKEKANQRVPSGREKDEEILRKLMNDNGRATYFNAIFSNCHEYAVGNLY